MGYLESFYVEDLHLRTTGREGVQQIKPILYANDCLLAVTDTLIPSTSLLLLWSRRWP